MLIQHILHMVKQFLLRSSADCPHWRQMPRICVRCRPHQIYIFIGRNFTRVESLHSPVHFRLVGRVIRGLYRREYGSLKCSFFALHFLEDSLSCFIGSKDWIVVRTVGLLAGADFLAKNCWNEIWIFDWRSICMSRPMVVWRMAVYCHVFFIVEFWWHFLYQQSLVPTTMILCGPRRLCSNFRQVMRTIHVQLVLQLFNNYFVMVFLVQMSKLLKVTHPRFFNFFHSLGSFERVLFNDFPRMPLRLPWFGLRPKWDIESLRILALAFRFGLNNSSFLIFQVLSIPNEGISEDIDFLRG